MLTDLQREYIRKATRTIQIIVASLAAGVLAFLGVVLYLVQQNALAPAVEVPIVTYISIGMAIVVIAMWLVVPAVIAGRMRHSIIHGDSSQWGLVKNMHNGGELGDVVPLMATYQTSAIVGAALIEGGAFLATIAFLLEHQRTAMLIGIALAVLLVIQIPTVSRAESWVERELSTIQQLRQMQ